MAACRFGDSCFDSSFLKGPLEDGFVQVVPASVSRYPVCVMAGCRKDPLPTPFPRGVGVLPLKRVGQGDCTQASPEIFLMLPLDPLQMSKERLLYRRGKRGIAVLISLATANHDLVLRKVNVFDS